VKAKRLKSFIDWFLDRAGGDVGRLRAVPPDRLREELLEVRGIGPETADSILLYALGVPTFVVDAYTHRILSRHALVPEETSYEEMKGLFEGSLPRDAALYNEFHALLVAAGKEYCRPAPRCARCPLRRFLPK
jgi:endonuclease-3 related protein